MQQIHARLVGFGVSQFEQRWNSKTSGIPCISTLRSHVQGQNNTYTLTQHVTTLNKQWYKTQVHSQNDAPENTPRPLATGVLYTDKRADFALSG